ncbi:MAG: GNAT family N-acetyltransferase [Rhodospirillales bacterium]
MTIRNLDRMFRPGSVALIGASRRAGSIGALIARNIVDGGFDGPIYPVNPKAYEVEGLRCWPDVASLPEPPDLAVIATPPATVPELVAELGARGTRAAVVITAGFAEGHNAEGRRLQQALLDAARPHLLRVAGPNCVGIMVPGHGLNASFAHIAPRAGDIAFAAQSGAVLTAIIDWAEGHGIGFSHLVSLGDMADVDFGDMIDYLAGDPGTRAILLYVEAVTEARKFMSAARAASRIKPLVVMKGGRHAEAAQAVASHTGALAGADAVYDAAFRRAGALRVFDMAELFDAVATLAKIKSIPGDRVAILTNGGGMGILATDALLDRRGRLAALSPDTIAALDAALPPTWSRGNPVDIIGDAPGSRYAAALEALLADPGSDAVIVLNCPTAVASGIEAARAVADTVAARASRKPVLTSWVGEAAAADARALFTERGIPTYRTPDEVVRGLMHLVEYRRNQDMLAETPPSLPPGLSVDLDRARPVVDAAMQAGQAWLTGPEAQALLGAAGIPTPGATVARTPADAAAAAAALQRPVALKIRSPDILHKSDVGGVALNLAAPDDVRRAAEAMLARIGAAKPDARIDGFTVEPMIARAHARELIIGIADDAQFGPVILFGHGGTAVEIIDDKALALPPLNIGLAYAAMKRTRVWRLLQAHREQPAAALDEVAATLVRVSQLLVEVPEIVELDINPLLADADGVMAVDARIRLAPPRRPGAARLAIRPYPRELEAPLTLPGGAQYLVRPIRPEDEPAIHAMFARLSPDAIRLRFFSAMRALPHHLAARLTQIDYDREMAFVAVPPHAHDDLHGVARLAADPDNERAEYAVLVRTDLVGRGLGSALMENLIAYARARGIGEVYGHVLRENAAMLELARSLGFAAEADGDDSTVVTTRLRLR